MSNPFDILGIRAWADPDEIRAAYRNKAKQCHPDRFQDPAQKEIAAQKMTELNLAYEEALRLATPRQNAVYHQELPKSEAVTLARKMLHNNNARSAMRQLLRSDSRDAAWYYTQGQIYMVLEQYEEAHQAFRQAIKLNPEENTYRSGALDAMVAIRKSKTLSGRIKKLFNDINKK